MFWDLFFDWIRSFKSVICVSLQLLKTNVNVLITFTILHNCTRLLLLIIVKYWCYNEINSEHYFNFKLIILGGLIMIKVNSLKFLLVLHGFRIDEFSQKFRIKALNYKFSSFHRKKSWKKSNSFRKVDFFRSNSWYLIRSANIV